MQLGTSLNKADFDEMHKSGEINHVHEYIAHNASGMQFKQVH